MHLHWGSHVEVGVAPVLNMSRGSEQPANKLSRWLFSRVLASHAGGLGSSPGRDMSVLGPLEEYSNDLGQVWRYCYFFKVLKGAQA